MFSVGEISADKHCAKLVRQLKKIFPDAKYIGIGGEHMEKEGVEIIFNTTMTSSVGMIEYYDFYKELKNIREKFLELIIKEKPDLIIFMDMEGFNLDLAKKIKKKKLDIKTLYYITPQRWMLRIAGDLFVKELSKNVDNIITTFEKEQEIYLKYSNNSIFLGNPLLTPINTTKDEKKFREEKNINKNQLLVGILPGSRKQEVHSLTEILLDVCVKINREFDAKFIIPIAHKNYENYFEKLLLNYTQKYNIDIILEKENSLNVINACDIVLLSSGSATLETALLGKPMVIVYKISCISYILAKILYRYKYIGLPNIILGKMIVPELLQKNVTPDKIFFETRKLLNNKKQIENIKKEFDKLKTQNYDTISKVVNEIRLILKN